jgi:hypothetical protein
LCNFIGNYQHFPRLLHIGFSLSRKINVLFRSFNQAANACFPKRLKANERKGLGRSYSSSDLNFAGYGGGDEGGAGLIFGHIYAWGW